MLPSIPNLAFVPRRLIPRYLSEGWTLVDPEMDGSGWAVLMEGRG